LRVARSAGGHRQCQTGPIAVGAAQAVLCVDAIITQVNSRLLGPTRQSCGQVAPRSFEGCPAGCSAFRQATPNPQGFGATVARHGKQSEVGQQILHRLDFLLLALGDGFSQLDGGRVLALSYLGLCHGDGALMVPDHAL
jgi:hypothetical protein